MNRGTIGGVLVGMTGSDGGLPEFPQLVLDALGANPDAPAFEHGTRTVRRGEVLATIGRLAAGMRAVGLGPGHGIAMATSVSPEAFAAHIAAHTLGCRVVGIRPGYPPRQLAHVLGAGVEAIVVDSSTMTPDLLAAADQAIVLSLGECGASFDLLGNGAGGPITVAARQDDVARLVYTSGSTGQPKGCAHTYRAMSELSLWQPAGWCPATARLAECTERYLLFGTLASVVIMEFYALCLFSGGTAVIPDPTMDPLFPNAIERYRITATLMTVPRLYRMLDILDRTPFDTGSLRAIVVSGSPVSPRRFAGAVRRLGPVMWQNYGQSEAGSLTILTPEDIAGESPAASVGVGPGFSGPESALSSVGRPHTRVELSIRDAGGRPLPAGEAGEVFVRPYLMSGYWNDEEQTAEALVDGWLRTRDVGFVDGNGFLHLSGRTRDVIIVNAMPYYAGPIERVLASHPDVAEAYVVGAPDERTGEAVHAYVIPTAGATPDRDALTKLVTVELGEACAPRTITVVAEVPIATSGKPDKRALLAKYMP